MYTFFGIMLIIHMAECIITGLFYKKGIIRIPAIYLLLVVLIPVWGCSIALLVSWEMNHKRKEKQNNDKEKEVIGVRQKNVIAMTDFDEIVPLEEAMVVNKPDRRRTLLFSLLSKDINRHIKLLQEVACAGDVEVAHYAITALSELQKEYEDKIRKKRAVFLNSRKENEALKEYSNILYDYITSGLIDGDIQNIQRKKYSELSKMQRQYASENSDLFFKSVENEMELGNYTLVEELLDYMTERWGENENVWITKINFLSKLKRETELQDVLQEIEKKKVYFSANGKKVIDFWSMNHRRRSDYEKEREAVL